MIKEKKLEKISTEKMPLNFCQWNCTTNSKSKRNSKSRELFFHFFTLGVFDKKKQKKKNTQADNKVTTGINVQKYIKYFKTLQLKAIFAVIHFNSSLLQSYCLETP